MKILRFLLRLCTCAPVMKALAERLDGHKTKIGLLGSGLTVVVYYIYAMFPDMVDPNLVDPTTVETALQTAIASFLTLAFGGMGHKVVKKQREKKQTKDLAEKEDPVISNYDDYEQH